MDFGYEIRAFDGDVLAVWEFGTGERARVRAFKKAQKLQASGAYDVVYVCVKPVEQGLITKCDLHK